MSNGSPSSDRATVRAWKPMSIVRSYACCRWSGRQTSPRTILIRICTRRIPLALSNSLRTPLRWRPRSNSQSSWPSQTKAVACSALTTWSWRIHTKITAHRTHKKRLTANLWWMMVQLRANVPPCTRRNRNCRRTITMRKTTIGKASITIIIIAQTYLACWMTPWQCPSKTAKLITQQTLWRQTWPPSQSWFKTASGQVAHHPPWNFPSWPRSKCIPLMKIQIRSRKETILHTS